MSPREPVVGQPGQRRLVDDVAVAQDASASSSKRKSLDGVEGPADAGHHAVPPALGQPPREQLEDRPPVRGARLQRGLEHRQLVVVGEQGGRGAGCAGHARVTVPRWCACQQRAPSRSSPRSTPDEITVVAKPWVDDRLERPGEPDVLRDLRVPEVLRLRQEEGREADARGAQRRPLGRSSTGTREEMERDVQAMHEYGLWATMETGPQDS